MSAHAPFLVYGSYGYTGELVVRYALEQGLRPVLAGRDAAKVKAQAEQHGLDHRAFSLDSPDTVAKGLEGMTAVIHCAGPFQFTARAMAEGCMRTGCHYLDITGEITVFELMAALGKKAAAAGVMLLPGAGFDVVPSDCLAAHLKRRMPDAIDLLLAFHGSGGLSHGTQLTMTINIPRGGAIRSGGKITPVPAAWQVRDIDFGECTQTCMTIPWGDVSTAYYSTGIPDIQVYMAAPPELRKAAVASRYLGKLMGWGPVQKFLQSKIKPGGPSDSARAKGYSLLWGEVSNEAGEIATSRLKTPEGYTLTALTALLIVQRVLNGHAPVGFQTPSLAYGPDLIMEIPGVTRTDV